MSLTVVGNTVKLAPNASATSNVANVATQTTTFHVCNATSNVYAYVGIFSTYAAAAAMDYPSVGTDAGGVVLVPNESMTIEGNFGPGAIANGTVYVSAITASGTASVFFTPVASGSISV